MPAAGDSSALVGDDHRRGDETIYHFDALIRSLLENSIQADSVLVGQHGKVRAQTRRR
jgi:hypothetical protein